LVFFDEVIPIDIEEIAIEQSSNISEEKGTILYENKLKRLKETIATK